MSELKLKIDYEGNPYITCFQSGDSNEDDLMSIFIRKAKEEGLIIVNESSFENVDDYITIRLANSKCVPLNSKILILKQ